MNSAKVITGILAGVVIGLLIAPAKGSETRKKLSKTVNDLSDYLQDTIDAARDEVNDLADKGIASVEEAELRFNDSLSM
jgi:gas vesicle protein